MLYRLKKLVPGPLIGLYHRVLSGAAEAWYGHPSRKLIVVGITGTNGKTTTSYLTSKVLEASGFPTGCTTTAIFKIGQREWLNKSKMTMLGRFALQKLLSDMVKEGCRYVVVETSSQGIVQHRHRGIEYDVVVLTNLTPEHIEAHGGFENYKNAKIELFRHASRRSPKMIDGKAIPKIAVLNRESEHAKDFVVAGFDQTLWYGIGSGDVSAVDLEDRGWSTSFSVDGKRATVNLPGKANVENALAALAVAKALGISADESMKRLASVAGVPGRFERVEEGQSFTVLVDYAPEPASIATLYAAAEKLPHKRIIHVLGSCGGGRDVARRPILGKMAGEHADVVIVTNEDPYDDDPQEIIHDVAEGARSAGKTGSDLKEILDRGEAIQTAVDLAEEGDLVLLTGKGCEQAIMLAEGRRLPWDEREEARKAIQVRLSRG